MIFNDLANVFRSDILHLPRYVSAYPISLAFARSPPELTYGFFPPFRTLCTKDSSENYTVEYRYGLPHVTRLHIKSAWVLGYCGAPSRLHLVFFRVLPSFLVWLVEVIEKSFNVIVLRQSFPSWCNHVTPGSKLLNRCHRHPHTIWANQRPWTRCRWHWRFSRWQTRSQEF